MPIRPPAITYQCPKCHWKKTVWPTADALTPHDIPPSQCPKCAHGLLTSRPATLLEKVMLSPVDALSNKSSYPKGKF